MPTCMDALDIAYTCATPANQVNEYYRNGSYDNCYKAFKELLMCGRAKMLSEQDAQEYLKGTILDPKVKDSTNSVWEPKEVPQWKS